MVLPLVSHDGKIEFLDLKSQNKLSQNNCEKNSMIGMPRTESFA